MLIYALSLILLTASCQIIGGEKKDKPKSGAAAAAALDYDSFGKSLALDVASSSPSSSSPSSISPRSFAIQVNRQLFGNTNGKEHDDMMEDIFRTHLAKLKATSSSTHDSLTARAASSPSPDLTRGRGGKKKPGKGKPKAQAQADDIKDFALDAIKAAHFDLRQKHTTLQSDHSTNVAEHSTTRKKFFATALTTCASLAWVAFQQCFQHQSKVHKG